MPASSRAVAGETAFQSETSGRAPSPGCVGQVGGDHPRLVGRRDREHELRRRDDGVQVVRELEPRLLGEIVSPRAPTGDRRDDAPAAGTVGRTDGAPHRARADNADGHRGANSYTHRRADVRRVIVACLGADAAGPRTIRPEAARDHRVGVGRRGVRRPVPDCAFRAARDTKLTGISMGHPATLNDAEKPTSVVVAGDAARP